MPIGRIQQVPLREVWPHEERDFSLWLSENIDVLSQEIGTRLSTPSREQPAGDFSVDLVAKSEDGRTVIIENQLERSDHDHLAKLVTYAAAYSADVAVWITADARSEHIAAVAWLNQTSSTEFFVFKLEAVRIGNSDPAPNLVLVVEPSRESRVVGENRKTQVDDANEFRRFWAALLPVANARTKLHTNISPGKDNWLAATSGVPGFVFLYRVLKDRWRVTLEIYDDRPAWNKRAFDALIQKKSQIEAAYGSPLIWDSRPTVRGSWVSHESTSGGLASPESDWPSIHAAMVEAMLRLHQALTPHLREAASAAETHLSTLDTP